MSPLLGFMMVALETGPVPPGRLDAGLLAPPLALRAPGALVPALARGDSAEDLAVRGGEGARALQVCRGHGGKEVTQRGHGRSPGMRELRCS
jgi:hypothetical protein